MRTIEISLSAFESYYRSFVELASKRESPVFFVYDFFNNVFYVVSDNSHFSFEYILLTRRGSFSKSFKTFVKLVKTSFSSIGVKLCVVS